MNPRFEKIAQQMNYSKHLSVKRSSRASSHVVVTSRASESGGATVSGLAVRRKRPRKWEVVLQAAERAFVEYGYAGTSMDAIAERAGVSKKTVYSNYKTKELLYAAVIRKRCAEVVPREIVSELLDADPVETLLKWSVSFLQALFAPEQIALYQTVVADSRFIPEVGQMMFDGPVMQSQAVFDQYFRAQAKRGRMRFQSLDLAAAHYVALIKSNMHMSLMLTRSTDISPRHLRKVVRSAIDLLLHGCLVQEASSGSSKSARKAT